MAVVARTYARALYGAAKDKDRLGEIREELDAFSGAIRDIPELQALIRNPELDTRAKTEALDAVLEDADELLRDFVRLVTEKGRAPMLEEIAREYGELVAAEERLLTVKLTTAYELSDEDAASLVKQIEAAAGRRVDAARSVDPDLIGGLVLKVGSLEVDSSVQGRLDRLRRELAGAST